MAPWFGRHPISTMSPQEYDVTATAPIRQLTLYKHGVAQVTRETRSGDAGIRLSLRHSELDDALKSLCVLARDAGGAVTSVAYEAPAATGSHAGPQHRVDPPTQMTLDAGRALTQLIEQMTGWSASVVLSGRAEALVGRVLGLEHDATTGARTLLLQDATSASVHVLPTTDVVSVTPLDAALATRLTRTLDARRQPDGRQAIDIHVASGAQNLALSYLVPCPSWRVSYRVFLDTASSAPDPSPVRLQAWAVVDNLFGEDLEAVQVSLVAGQPVSFHYELTTPPWPDRPRVKDVRPAPTAPIGFEAALDWSPPAAERRMSDGPASFLRRGHDVSAPLSLQEPLKSLGDVLSDDDQTVEAASAAGDAQGALFAYRVQAPVTIAQGRSGLVPLLDLALGGRALLLFNEAKHQTHPIRSVLCRNDTSYVLERGPATLFEAGRYIGEALLPFSPSGAELHLPYAVELGLTVRCTQEVERVVVGLSHHAGAFHSEHSFITTRTWTVENRTDTDEVLIVECEQAALPGELADDCKADESVGAFHRWRMTCPARASASHRVRAVKVERRQVSAQSVDAA